jgi:hypothetical protein
VNGSDLPVKHWLYVAGLFPIGAVLGVLVRGVPMAVNWWLMRADNDVMRWVELTDDDR